MFPAEIFENMRTGNRRAWGIVTVGLIGILALIMGILFTLPEIRYRKLVRKYPVGTDAQTVLKDYAGKVQLKRTEALPYEPREDEKKRLIFYYLTLTKENAEIQFNSYQEVIRIKKLSTITKPK